MKRIHLKLLTEKNMSPNYITWINDKQINKYLEVRYKKQSKRDIQNYVKLCKKTKGTNLFGIFLKKEKIHIGNIKLDNIDPRHKRGVVGLFIGEKKYWGQGIASEAIKLITTHAKKKLKLRKLQAGCYSNNIASKKAFLKAGWKIEAKFKNYWYDENIKKFVDGIVLANKN